MNTKILIILIVLTVLGIGGFFVYKNISAPKVEKEKVSIVEEKIISEEKEEITEEEEESEEKPIEERMTCEEYCRAQTHQDCSGQWDISGEYPNCLCNFICQGGADEAVEESQQEEAPTSSEVTLGPQTDWAAFHGNAARTGFSTSKAPAEPKMLWKWTSKDFQNTGYSGDFDTNWLIVENNKVFIPLEGIFVLDLATGKKLWAYTDEENFYPRGLTVGGDKLFVSVNKEEDTKNLPPGFIYAFDKKTGEFLWKYKTQAGISHSLPLFAENKVFIGDDSGTIYALNTEGDLVWKKYLEDAEVIHSSPAFYGGVIFVGTEGTARSNDMPSRLYALDVESGEELWRFQVDYISGKLNLIHSTPAISEGVVYIGSENGYFYAVSAEDGQLLWKKLIASGSDRLIGVSAAAAIGYDKVFIGTYEGKFLALNQDNGEIVWEYDFGKASADASPLLADQKVYFGVGEGGDGSFYCFDANSGRVIWKEKFGGSSPALASGVLVVQNGWLEESLSPETPIIIAYFES